MGSSDGSSDGCSSDLQHKDRIAKDSRRFGVSIGIAVCAHGSTALRTLMSRADKALYSAKSTGAGCLLEPSPHAPHLQLVHQSPAIAEARTLPICLARKNALTDMKSDERRGGKACVSTSDITWVPIN